MVERIKSDVIFNKVKVVNWLIADVGFEVIRTILFYFFM